jgi:hypothetical protein
MSIEILVRDYLRTDTALMGLLNDDPKRMNMDWIGDVRATHCTLYVAGGEYHRYLPVHHPLIVVHCFGSTRPAAAAVAEEVAHAVRSIHEGHRPLAAGEVLSLLYLPTTDGVSRYVVTTSVVTKLGLAA